MRRKLRVAAYAVCVRDDQLLLARGIDEQGEPEWTLPGGGMEHGEDPYDTVLREVDEETGYEVEITGLLGVDSLRRTFPYHFRRAFPRVFRRTTDHHALRLVYEARVTGGDLRFEVGGSTDLAAWHPLEEVETLNRVGLVDTGLALWRKRPAAGHLEPHPYPGK
ncbi:NUDIX hydrolase [Streptomyces sp. CA-249302]|uniref:NUDIX hydrolase n=1 Tax=Streptomyces sp. CA-249302 TaxID=3240058 RepID=UPI003D93F9A2